MQSGLRVSSFSGGTVLLSWAARHLEMEDSRGTLCRNRRVLEWLSICVVDALGQIVKEAKVALARKIAVILHRMWVDGSTYRWTETQPIAAQA